MHAIHQLTNNEIAGIGGKPAELTTMGLDLIYCPLLWYNASQDQGKGNHYRNISTLMLLQQVLRIGS